MWPSAADSAESRRKQASLVRFSPAVRYGPALAAFSQPPAAGGTCTGSLSRRGVGRMSPLPPPASHRSTGGCPRSRGAPRPREACSFATADCSRRGQRRTTRGGARGGRGRREPTAGHRCALSLVRVSSPSCSRGPACAGRRIRCGRRRRRRKPRGRAPCGRKPGAGPAGIRTNGDVHWQAGQSSAQRGGVKLPMWPAVPPGGVTWAELCMRAEPAAVGTGELCLHRAHWAAGAADTDGGPQCTAVPQ
jgi:hypothetical protein